MPEQRVGTVIHFYGKIGVAIVRLEAPVRPGDDLVIRGAHDDVPLRVESIEAEHARIPEGKPGQEVGIKVPGRVHEGSVAFRVTA